ncbi:MAG TPA: hypothetical protein VJN72_10855 [Gaiellales bacterium]|nr:hypothetical protein [Gaiellales bacterium]
MEIDTNLVVVDLATAWSFEAAAFLVAGLAFLAWSMAVRNPLESLVVFAAEVGVVMAFDRWLAVLPHADRLADASPLPTGARLGSPLRYLIVCIISVLRVRNMERQDGVEYRLRTAASRRGIQRYYVTSPAV